MATVGEVVRATLTYTAPNASEAQNVFHWIITGANIEDANIVGRLLTWALADWGDDWAALAPSGATIQTVDMQILNLDGTVERILGSEQVGLVGVGGSTVAVAAASGLMAATTVVPKATGKKYVPFLADNLVDDGQIEGGALISLLNLALTWIDLINFIGEGTLTPGVLRRALQAFEPFIGNGVVDATPAYQRRRKPGVGS